MMAFDGYVIVRHLNRGRKCDERTIGLFVDLLLPCAAPGIAGRPSVPKARQRDADALYAGRNSAEYK